MKGTPHLLLGQVDIDLHEGSGDLSPVTLISAQRLMVNGCFQLTEVLNALLQPLLPDCLCKCPCTQPAQSGPYAASQEALSISLAHDMCFSVEVIVIVHGLSVESQQT